MQMEPGRIDSRGSAVRDMDVLGEPAIYGTDVHRLAEFWAAAVGYHIEDLSPLIATMIRDGLVRESDSIIRNGRACWRNATSLRHPDDPVDLHTGIGLSRRILIYPAGDRSVPPPPAVLIRVDARCLPRHQSRLARLGAAHARGAVPVPGMAMMVDPAGNVFTLLSKVAECDDRSYRIRVRSTSS